MHVYTVPVQFEPPGGGGGGDGGLPYNVCDHQKFEKASGTYCTLQKPLMKVPYKGRTHLREQDWKKAVRPYYKSVRPRVLKLQENLFPNWSYDKMFID